MTARVLHTAADLTDADRETLAGAGIDWQALLAKLGPIALQVFTILLGLIVKTPVAKFGTPMCPEHDQLMHDTACLNLRAAANCLHCCCQGECSDE